MPLKTYHGISAVQKEIFCIFEQSLPEDRVSAAKFLVSRYLDELYPGIDEELYFDVNEIFDATQSMLNIMRHREVGETKLRIHNPTCSWTSEHTVIDIVNDDMPFLVDSITMELVAQGYTIHRLIHPVLPTMRNKKGILTGFAEKAKWKPRAAPNKNIVWESVIYIEIDRRANEHVLDTLTQRLLSILHDIRQAVTDWQPMRERAADIIADLDQTPASVSHDNLDEFRAYFTWLRAKNFVFLGCRDYEISQNENDETLYRRIPNTGLGILKNDDDYLFEQEVHRPTLTPRAASFICRPEPFYLIKTGRISTVHRRVRVDVIGVRCFDKDGTLVKTRLVAGLYASSAFSNPAESIPIIRKKIAWVLKKAALRPDSHNGKALLNILQTFPREELFLYQQECLLTTALGILLAQQHRKTAVFTRTDSFDHYVSCLIFVPRDSYDTTLRHQIADLLTDTWSGSVETFHALVADSPMARLHFTIKMPLGQTPSRSTNELTRQITIMSKPWFEDVETGLYEMYGEEIGLRLARRYANAFPASFRENHAPGTALVHIQNVEKIFVGSMFELFLVLDSPDRLTEFRLNLYHPQSPIPLSNALPVLENMGFRVTSEQPHRIQFDNPSETVWLHIFSLETESKSIPNPATLCKRLEMTFLKVWRGEAENDRFNRLVLFAGLEWRTVVLLRAYTKYLRQIRFPFSQEMVIEALTASPEMSAQLIALFDARFNPQQTGDQTPILRGIEKSLNMIESPDYDKIFRRLLNLILFTLRTNFYQKNNGEPKSYISFKLDTRKLDELPSPRPWVEVWVYSPRVEAIHLRAGKIARGGIRWSERREDFRTEILGLLKSQIIKNAVTVSNGAKGGFVVKMPPSGREALLLESVECYRTMICGLLDITDNLNGDTIIPPLDVVHLDEDDPYLVVAADKGTSSFSDIANAIALDYNYWLGDAFASSGSYGYDRRAMGITARGTWESLKRHFRELGMDAQSEDFTIIGIGDMSGDVFGNSMLRSPHIQLVAAFNHRHIFLDPNPTDTFASFNERLRLFQMPHSQWINYTPSLISPGGGVFARNTKSVPISPQVKERFGIRHDVLSSAELIKALLRSSVDVLLFGGIGTYVKATEESHVDADDRTNDQVRINASELHCQIVVEGGNLGLTQKGRIEYAQGGGRINIDAIDNSAGVDASDHEVNIKILLNDVMESENITLAQRNLYFHSTTDEVSTLVLRDNYLQTQRISATEARAPKHLGRHAQLIRSLERAGRLDRTLLVLPDEEEIAERAAAKRGLVRPEIATLMSYAKLALFDKLVSCDFPDDPYLVTALQAYFPSEHRKRFAPYMGRHRLRRDIIATSISNELINRCGISFVSHIENRTGRSTTEIARAYVIACTTFDLPNLWEAIEAMDTIVPSGTQISLLHAVEDLLEQSVIRILHRGTHPLDMATSGAVFSNHVSALFATLPSLLSADMADALQAVTYQMESQGTSTALARRIARLSFLSSVPDIADLCKITAMPTTDVARCYFNVISLFSLNLLRENITLLFTGDHWQRLAASALWDDLIEAMHRLTCIALRDPPELLAIARRYYRMSAELKTMPALDLATLTVACRHLTALSMA